MSAPSASIVKPARISSIDAYRGLVMCLMLGEVLHLCGVAELYPDSGFWSFVCHHQSHVSWVGCALHDMIQPSFSFLVGVALPFSIASRVAKGSSFGVMLGHAAWRSLLLIFLGIFLRSIGRSQTYFTFEDTLTQIGLGYVFLFLLGFRSTKFQWGALGLILFGYWLAFAMYPVPGPGFDWSQTGVDPNWANNATGFAAHWNKNTNLAWAVDNWWLNLFPRENPFQFNGGGYATLSFLPTLGTMILGLIAGNWLKADLAPRERMKRFLIAGVLGLFLGWLLNATGICPNVKKIWTPAWVLFSSGWCFLFLAFFYWVMDMRSYKTWAFPLIVVGTNSIFAYCSEWFFMGFLRDSVQTNFGVFLTSTFGEFGAEFTGRVAALVIVWLMLLWLYRRKVFIKI